MPSFACCTLPAERCCALRAQLYVARFACKTLNSARKAGQAKLDTPNAARKAQDAKLSTQKFSTQSSARKARHPKLRTQSSARRRQTSTRKTQHPNFHKQHASVGEPNAQAGELFQAWSSKRIDLRPHHGHTLAGGTFGRIRFRYSNRIVRTPKAEALLGNYVQTGWSAG